MIVTAHTTAVLIAQSYLPVTLITWMLAEVMPLVVFCIPASTVSGH